MYGFWEMECDRIFSGVGLFFALLPPNNPENQNFEKINTWRYYDFTHVYHKWQSYDVWFLSMESYGQNFVILDRFLLFYPNNNSQNQNFLKMKETSRDIIILHMCTLNDMYKMHGSWDMERNNHNFLSLWTVFCPFTLLTPKKSKFWKIKKTPGDILILHMCTKNYDHRCTVPEKWCATVGQTHWKMTHRGGWPTSKCQTDRRMDGWTDRQTYRQEVQ